MKQGEIWNVNLNPTKGSEQAGFRPALIISGNLMNEYMNVVIVIPLTTKVKEYKGNVVLEPSKSNGLKKRSEVLNFHVRSVAKDRLAKRLGKVTAEQVVETKNGLNEILTF